MRRRYAGLLDERVFVWDEIDHLGIYQVHNEMDFMPANHAAGPGDEDDSLDDAGAPSGVMAEVAESTTNEGV